MVILNILVVVVVVVLCDIKNSLVTFVKPTERKCY